MAHYGVKYRGTFKDINNQPYRLDIEELDYYGAITTVLIDTPPVVTYPDIKKGVDWLFSSGCEFSLVSTGNMDYIDMFTNEMQKYRVTILLDGLKVWCGFLDTETYTEDFNQSFNYSVQFSANDGLKLLERYLYLDNGNNYTGMTSLWEVIKRCMKTINFNEYKCYVNCNTHTTGATFDLLDDYTTLDKIYVQSENFYDEDNKPMNMYALLKSILSTYGLYMFQNPTWSVFYIVDDISYWYEFPKGVYFRVYNVDDGTWDLYDAPDDPLFVHTINPPNDSYWPTLGIRSNSSKIEILPGVNGAKVNLSLYAKDTLTDYVANASDMNNLSGITSYAITSDYKWREYNYESSTVWDVNYPACICKYEGYGTKNSGVTDYYLKMNKGHFGAYSDSTFFTIKKPMPFLDYSSGKYSLKIEMEVMFQTKDKPDDQSEGGKDYRNGLIGLFVRVGDKQYINSGGYGPMWTTGYDTFRYDLLYYGDSLRQSSICDLYLTNSKIISKYKDLQYGGLIPLESNLYGDLTISISNNVFVWDGDPNNPNSDMTYNIKGVRIRGFKVSIVNNDGTELKLDDVIYESKFDEKYESAASEIKSIIGSNVNVLPYCKAATFWYDGGPAYGHTHHYKNIVNYTKGWYEIIDWDTGDFILVSGKTDLLEKHSLENILNSYKVKKYHLTITTTIPILWFTKVQYPTQLPNIYFLITGAVINYADGTAELKLTQIT